MLDAEFNFASNGWNFNVIALETYAGVGQNTGFRPVLLACLGEICSSACVHHPIGFVGCGN